ncbi:MAG: acyltransferase [Phycisphaerales bacterium]|jgi:acetyltransferase-like isoleucine patch superfamily enzyme
MIHPTAHVDDWSVFGANPTVWHWTHVRAGCRIGDDVSVGQCCYIDEGVTIGDGCRIQNSVNLYKGVSLGRMVFVGPSVTFTNDLHPRLGEPWSPTPTTVGDNVSIGANATILCGIVIGDGAMIGCGAVVTKDVPPGATVKGGRAR